MEFIVLYFQKSLYKAERHPRDGGGGDEGVVFIISDLKGGVDTLVRLVCAEEKSSWV